nr:putative transposase (putative), gypsy type [Tanacetum cinerariifolium]
GENHTVRSVWITSFIDEFRCQRSCLGYHYRRLVSVFGKLTFFLNSPCLVSYSFDPVTYGRLSWSGTQSCAERIPCRIARLFAIVRVVCSLWSCGAAELVLLAKRLFIIRCANRQDCLSLIISAVRWEMWTGVSILDHLCNTYNILAELGPELPSRDDTIKDAPTGKIGIYTQFLEFANFRIPLSRFLLRVLEYYQINFSQLFFLGATKVSHLEIMCRVLSYRPSLATFRKFYVNSISNGWMSFSRRGPTSCCLMKNFDSLKNWNVHFFWIDASICPISFPWHAGAFILKDPLPSDNHVNAELLGLLDNHCTIIRRYPETFLCLVGLSRSFDDVHVRPTPTLRMFPLLYAQGNVDFTPELQWFHPSLDQVTVPIYSESGFVSGEMLMSEVIPTARAAAERRGLCLPSLGGTSSSSPPHGSSLGIAKYQVSTLVLSSNGGSTTQSPIVQAHDDLFDTYILDGAGGT